MACNNTYIGARYVPVYADPVEWSPDREYEHLTIVTHEGNSYTSRCAVPIGITLDNKEYWVQSFLAPPEIVAINAKIKTIQQELAKQADNIASIEEEIKNLQGGSSALESRVEALETSQAAQDTEIANIKTEQTTQNTDINTLKTDVTGLDTRVTNLETSQADQDLKIASLENKDTEQDDKLTDLETSQAAQDTEIATIKQLQAAQANDIADLNTRLTAAELQVETNKTDISALNTKTDKTNTDLSNLSATVQAHTQSITNLNGEIINHDAEINNLKDVNAQLAERLDNQETELNTTNANVSNLSTTVANQTTAINSIQTQLNDQHDDINELQQGQATLTNQYNTLTQSLTETNKTVSGIQTDIDEINEKIKDVPSDITSLTAQVNKNTSDIESNDADILALQTSQQQQDTKITNLETEVGNHDMMLETLEDDMNALETHVSGLTSKVDTNTADILALQKKHLNYSNIYNIKDYGAVGDGNTDDTQAFQTFFDQTENVAKTQFITLIIPFGLYKITQSLNFTGLYNIIGLYKPNLNFAQAGIGINVGSVSAITRGRISGIYFNHTLTNTIILNVTNTREFNIEDCHFTFGSSNAGNTAIELFSGSGRCIKIYIDECTFSATCHTGLYINGTAESNHDEVDITRCQFYEVDQGIKASYSQNVKISDCFLSCGQCIILYQVISFAIVHCNTLSTTNSFLIQSCLSGAISNNELGNVGSYDICIEVSTSKKVTVTNNTMNGRALGIHFIDNEWCSIANNIIDTNAVATESETSRCGIFVQGGRGTNIIGNTVISLYTGIEVTKATALNLRFNDGYTVVGNTCLNCVFGFSQTVGTNNVKYDQSFNNMINR